MSVSLFLSSNISFSNQLNSVREFCLETPVPIIDKTLTPMGTSSKNGGDEILFSQMRKFVKDWNFIYKISYI